eukprot:366298-Chlamydomonas_euryale.AAC.14
MGAALPSSTPFSKYAAAAASEPCPITDLGLAGESAPIKAVMVCTVMVWGGPLVLIEGDHIEVFMLRMALS